jgi:two-component system cell cycle sensor histidine kinase/response regulator CckA
VSPDQTVERTVLVVDDYPALLSWACRAFRRAGWTVLDATDGFAALAAWEAAIAEGGRVDLLVTDLGMPELGGLELAQELRARDATLPIIALTGHADREEAWDGAVLERTSLFRKPVDGAEVIAAAEALTIDRAGRVV